MCCNNRRNNGNGCNRCNGFPGLLNLFQWNNNNCNCNCNNQYDDYYANQYGLNGNGRNSNYCTCCCSRNNQF